MCATQVYGRNSTVDAAGTTRSTAAGISSAPADAVSIDGQPVMRTHAGASAVASIAPVAYSTTGS